MGDVDSNSNLNNYKKSGPIGSMTILVAYDGSDPAQKAVEHAVRNYGDEEIILLNVVEVPTGLIDASIDFIQEQLKEERGETREKVSDELKELLRTEDIEFRFETLFGKPSKEIVSFAEENNVDTIVIGSHGRENVSRVLLGSVAENVVRRAPTTVAVVR